MKLIRHGEPGKEKPGVLLGDGTRIDVSGFGSDYNEVFFRNGGLDALAVWLKTNATSAPRVAPTARAEAPPSAVPAKLCALASTTATMPPKPVLKFPKSR